MRRFLVALAGTFVVACGSAVASPDHSVVTHAGRWLTDDQGRVVILHGFNMLAGGPGANVPNDPQTAFGFDKDDAAFLKAEGFNSMRIGILPQFIEPKPGVYDDRFIRKFVDLSTMLARYQIYLLLDFEQLDYGPATWGAGLPVWATITDGAPNPSLGYSGGYVGDPAMERAFDNLYANTPGPGGVGIADRLAAAEGHVAEIFAHQPYMLGYDLLNEPWPGSQYPTCTGSTGCPVFDQQSLTPFERKLIGGVRKADRTHLVFYEPNLDFDFGAASNLGPMGDPRAGFAFHVYCLGNTSAFGFPGNPPAGATQTGCGIEDQATMSNALAHGSSSGDALLMDEWGATTQIEDYQRGADEADANMLPWMNHAYYNCCGTGNTPYDQGVIIDPKKPPVPANLHEDRLDILDRPYPRAIAGTPTSWHWDSSTRTFAFDYSTRPTGQALATGARTEVWVGRRHYPRGYEVKLTGARVVSIPNADVLELTNLPKATSVHISIEPRARPPYPCSGQRLVRIHLPTGRAHVATVAVYVNGRRGHAHWTRHGHTVIVQVRRGIYRLRIVVSMRGRGAQHRIIVTHRYRAC